MDDIIFEPKMLAFLCNWCSYAGADLAGVSRFQYPPTVRVIRTLCSGRVDPLHVIEGLRNGFDSVLVFGCHFGDCHYLEGNYYAAKRIEVVQQLLELSGIGRDRVAVRWVSAAEGQLFANYVKELTDLVQNLGPFKPEEFAFKLKAIERALDSPRIRWLTGIDRQLTTKENVYHEKIDETEYRKMLSTAVEMEYQRAMIMEALREGPKSVREIALQTALPIYTVSIRLGDLEKMGHADLHNYEGTTPRFACNGL